MVSLSLRMVRALYHCSFSDPKEGEGGGDPKASAGSAVENGNEEAWPAIVLAGEECGERCVELVREGWGGEFVECGAEREEICGREGS